MKQILSFAAILFCAYQFDSVSADRDRLGPWNEERREAVQNLAGTLRAYQ